ncbi:MAG: ABC transporter substrate-binding protein, partial [Mycobacteriales bacterium]
MIGLTVLSVLATACGTRQSHDDVMAAVRGGAAVGQQSSSSLGISGTTGSAPADGLPSSGPAAAGAAVPGGRQSTPGSVASGPAATGGSGGPRVLGTGDHTPLVIGEVGTFSGLVGANGVPLRAALRAWVQATNAAGGVLGHPVQLISIDDQGNTSKAQAAVRRLVEE